jgi:hypothetical protein
LALILSSSINFIFFIFKPHFGSDPILWEPKWGVSLQLAYLNCNPKGTISRRFRI